MPTDARARDPYAVPPRPAPEEGDPDARERILRTAYELFREHGCVGVGVDRIVAEASVAKTTLYRHFRSKDQLVIAVLDRHEEVWTVGWLERASGRAAGAGAAPLEALFDALFEWFGQEDYEGCLFMNCLLETHDRSSPVSAAATASSRNVYELLRRLAKDARASDPDGLAHQLQLVMRGAIVAAVEANDEAVEHARALARDLIERETHV